MNSSQLRMLLVVPPLPERTYPGKAMAIDYLASALLREGVNVRSIDVDLYGVNAFVRELHAFEPQFVGITNMSIQNDAANRLAAIVRRRLPNAIVLKGGVHETFGAETTIALHHQVTDACIVGWGDIPIGEIAQFGTRSKFLDERGRIQGLAYWSGDQFEMNPASSSGDIDDCVPTRLNFNPAYNFEVFGNKKTAQVMTSRGCQDACFYCFESVMSTENHEQHRSIGSLEAEFLILKQEGYEAIYFDDSTFTRQRDRVLEITQLAKKFGFIWGCNTRVDCLDEDLIVTMREAGCVYLFCGVESGVPEILRGLNKTRSPVAYLEQAQRVYGWLRKSRLPCSAFLIFGGARMVHHQNGVHFEPESWDDVLASLEFSVNGLDPDFLSMNVMRFLPGLPMSTARQFECIRPNGEAIHGGHYDVKWYHANGRDDLRSSHEVFRAFEGRLSVNPPQMTPERCYAILEAAVRMVNRKNARLKGNQTRIVVDRRFERFLRERSRTPLKYELAPLDRLHERQPD